MTVKIGLTIILLGFTGFCYACKCGGPGTVKSSFEGSHVVVSGRVLSKQLVPFSQTIRPDSVSAIRERFKDDKQNLEFFEMNYFFKIDLSIVDRYKGTDLPDTVTIYTSMHSASCGYKFELGKSYIIYASNSSHLSFMFNDRFGLGKGSQKEDTYWTNRCTRTTEYNSVEADELTLLTKNK
jgi:hypothetical protein